MIKAVIFDFFGVFLPDVSLRWYHDVIGEPPSAAFFEICHRSDCGELSREAFYREVAVLTGKTPAQVKAGIEALFIIDTALIEDVRRLHRHYRTAILSNATNEWVDETLQRYRMTGLFDEIVLSAQVGLVKPEPEIFALTLRHLAVESTEAIFIDDREANVAAARDFGMEAVLFVDREQLRQQLTRLNIQFT